MTSTLLRIVSEEALKRYGSEKETVEVHDEAAAAGVSSTRS